MNLNLIELNFLRFKTNINNGGIINKVKIVDIASPPKTTVPIPR